MGVAGPQTMEPVIENQQAEPKNCPLSGSAQTLPDPARKVAPRPAVLNAVLNLLQHLATRINNRNTISLQTKGFVTQCNSRKHVMQTS